MLIAPENIELNKIVKQRRLNFDTANRMYGNLIFIPTENYDDYQKIINAKLFKPQQLYSVYTPRKIKPMNRTFVNFIQKDIYQNIREKTNSFIKIGKAMPSSYAGRNLLYNLIPEYTETASLLKTLKSAPVARHLYLQQYLDTLFEEKTDMLNYEKAYIIFPITDYIPNFRQLVNSVTSQNYSPLIEFLKSLRNKTIKKEKYKRIDRIFFYNPDAEAMIVMDPQDPDLDKEFIEYLNKIIRLNNYNGNSDALEDIDPNDIEKYQTEEDEIANTKDKIKDIVLNNVAKKLKAKLDDYDAATMDEKGIISFIDNKIDKYLDDDQNTNKPFAELVKEIESDKEIVAKSINYIEAKKISQKQLVQLSKNLDKETEIIDSIDDLKDDVDRMFEPEKIKAKLPDIVNKKVQESSLIAFDNKYNEIQAKKDLVSCITAFSDQDYLPISIIDYKLEDSSDDFTLKNTLTVRYKTDENKTFSFKLDIPIVYDGHYIKVKGNPYIIQKQLTRLPIVKTKENRVEITTNFNKITCERTNGHISRRNAYLKKVLQEHKLNPAYGIEYGYNIELNSVYKNDFEFEELSSFLYKINTGLIEINTNRPEVENEFELLNYPDQYTIDDTMTPVGFRYNSENQKNLLFIKNTKLYEAIATENKVVINEISENLYSFIMKEIFHEDPNKYLSIGKSFIYAHCKFIGVVYPIFVLCGLCIGMTSFLKKANIKYKLSYKPLPHDTNWIEIKFKNKYFYYEDKMDNTILLNILYALHTEDWNFEDFDTDAPYVDYCVNTLGQPIYVKQTVRINISKLIDPITRDVLNYLKLPTDPFSLLIMAGRLLTNNSYILKNDLCNYRVRGNELIYAIMYEIIAKAYYKYQNAKLNGSNKETIKINQNELISTLIAQQNINIASNLNPVLEVEASSSCSMKGHKGINLRDAYTIELRNFDKSMVGILSANSTPFSGAVGIQRSLTVNPKINHVRGFMPTIEEKSLDPTNVLSASEILSYTTSSRSDPPRASMQVGQAKHGVPVYKTHRQLLTSGFDRTMPYMISDGFCFKAKENGIVEEINSKEQIAILKYDSGKYDAIDLKETLAKNSNSGFYINQKYTIKYEVGERFNAGDVIAYNPSFFVGKGNDCSFTQGTLAKVAITAGDFVFEDSTYISDRLSELCAADITMEKPVALGPNAIIHKIVEVGDHVDVNDELLNFTTSFNDPTTTEFLQDLIDTIGDDDTEDIGNEKILSKYSGRIADIDIFYNVPFETLSPSLKTMINKYNKKIESRKKELLAKGIKPAAINLKAIGEQNESKIHGTEFNGVLIVFYITHKDKLTIGDKLTYSVALKGIITRVASNEEAPISEFRQNEIIDGCCAASGVPSRMTMDVFPQLYGNKLLIELGRWIHSEWNK